MWEYRVATFKAEDLEGWLNTAGGMGWELTYYRYFRDVIGDGPGDHQVILKRPKSE